MEIVGAVLTGIGLLKDFWSSISKCFNYAKILDENRTTLQEKMESLRSREHDVITELQNAQYHRKKARKEVEDWLKKVQRLKDGVEEMEQEAARGRCFSRLGFLKQLEENAEKIDKLLDLAKFPHGILIDVAPDVRGKALLTTEVIGETTAKRNLETIWTSLEKGEVHRIGIWGMGGIGKTTLVTHIHNRILENEGTFGFVYWVTVSKDSSIYKLQDAIAGKVNLDLSREQDQKMRSASLLEELQRKGKFVLILDDVWKVYELKDAGIPIGAGGGKLIITTRSKEVCLRMGCKEIIRVELLLEEEAWELFNGTLDRYNALSAEEEEIAKDIVKECAGLPLAIATTARSLSAEYDLGEWRNALTELREHLKGHKIDMENQVYKILEFSFHRLNDDKIQECLLYCALFPEDTEIRRMALIRYWIAEGLVEEIGTMQAECDRGHAILNKLESVCLLERCEDGEAVKMHDVIRDMAINITGKSSKFMVKIRKNLENIPGKIEWSNKLERVSFIGSQLSNLMFEPNCPRLCTLFLQDMGLHEGLQNSFFVHTTGLRVLDMSFTSISSLPNSVYDLVNLRALLLSGCENLKHVGSLAKLKELRELGLRNNQMEMIPDGIEKLVSLKQFDWTSRLEQPEAVLIPSPNLFSCLVHLQCLNFLDNRVMDVGAEELCSLTRLHTLNIKFSSLHKFNSYMRTHHYLRLAHYYVRLNVESINFGMGRRGYESLFSKEVRVKGYIWNGEKDKDDNQLVLPTNLRVLHMVGCLLPESLSDVCPSLKLLADLEECMILECEGLEYLWRVEDCNPWLNTLRLKGLRSLRDLFKFRPTEIGSSICSNMKRLVVTKCGNLKQLFVAELVKYHLQNLVSIDVEDCYKMEDIIAAEAEGEENMILAFPNLEWLRLSWLPKLRSIWKGTVLTCDSLKHLAVNHCPRLARLPISVYISDGETRASKPPLQRILGSHKWWDEVVWDTHPLAKSHFQHLFQADNESTRVALYISKAASMFQAAGQ